MTKRSIAQQAADKRYQEKNKGKFVSWGTKFSAEEIKRIDSVIKTSGKNRAEFLRWAVEKYLEENK